MLYEKTRDINPILAVAKKKQCILESMIECNRKKGAVSIVAVCRFAKCLLKK